MVELQGILRVFELITDESLEPLGAADWGGRWLDAHGMAVVVMSRDLAVLWSSRAVPETLSPDGPVTLRDGYPRRLEPRPSRPAVDPARPRCGRGCADLSTMPRPAAG